MFKLDMEKAYDRMDWGFMMKVLAKMGFNNVFSDKIWRLVANNWYSVLINGQASRFFHSTRGVKQGDPLSPSLFILAAEVLSRALNNLHSCPQYKSFGLPKWSENISHLAYADDTIIFANADSFSINLLMNTLQEYERQSGQKINRDKSVFFVHNMAAHRDIQLIEECSGFPRGKFPLTYLIGHARKRKTHFADLMKKVLNKLQVWKGKLLSFGGKVVLISNVLQSVPIYQLSAIIPPNCVIHDLHKLFARFMWSFKEGCKNKHWVSWTDICQPKWKED